MELSPEVASYLRSHRVARLATATPNGVPHVVPIVYAFDGQSLFFALDAKPKRVPVGRLRRVRNILANPRVAVLVDDYSEDWGQLSFVLVHGAAEVLGERPERDRAHELLRQKYPQYQAMPLEGAPVVRITPTTVVAWPGPSKLRRA
ncbi:MAG: TIGR03668 family PPOX class F420-dependent oxidoreductase [Chloroflexi bacterium]|nr:TIGR03668 family PPOX class F420-dependent oxidoreductase [Chloroflexota bacterium]